jgi:RNA polymerase sigma-70 factor (ECF subfamily)
MMNWPEIVKQHGPLVWQTAYRLLCHEADTWDCFQDAFLDAVALARKEAILSWPALLKRLAVTRSLNRLRQRRREAKRVQPLQGDPACSREPAPDEAARRLDLANVVGFSFTASVDSISDAPEPSSLTLLCLGGLGLAGYGWWRRRQSVTT